MDGQPQATEATYRSPCGRFTAIFSASLAPPGTDPYTHVLQADDRGDGLPIPRGDKPAGREPCTYLPWPTSDDAGWTGPPIGRPRPTAGCAEETGHHRKKRGLQLSGSHRDPPHAANYRARPQPKRLAACESASMGPSMEQHHRHCGPPSVCKKLGQPLEPNPQKPSPRPLQSQTHVGLGASEEAERGGEEQQGKRRGRALETELRP
ncbi:hypothetical protein J3F83DRAFT_753971 [Trichoderma novae-zelandiae]